MRQRNVLVTVPYYNYEPHRVLIGIMPAPVHDVRDPVGVIAETHKRSPGWASISLCEQQPVGLIRCNKLRVLASMPGSINPATLHADPWVPDMGGI